MTYLSVTPFAPAIEHTHMNQLINYQENTMFSDGGHRAGVHILDHSEKKKVRALSLVKGLSILRQTVV
jgi:hypothetical protein